MTSGKPRPVISLYVFDGVEHRTEHATITDGVSHAFDAARAGARWSDWRLHYADGRRPGELVPWMLVSRLWVRLALRLDIPKPPRPSHPTTAPTKEMRKFVCPECGNPSSKPAATIRANRARAARDGVPMGGPYCGRACASQVAIRARKSKAAARREKASAA